MTSIMSKYEKLKSELKRFKKEDSGVFLVTAALMTPVIILTVAATVQYTIASKTKSRLQQNADAALMAGVIEANKMESLDDLITVKQKIRENVDAFLAAGLGDDKSITYKVKDLEYDPLTHKASLKVSYTYPDFMPLITGNKQTENSVGAAAHLYPKTKTPISMYLVLDKSGSMGWDGRMAALKVAVANLTVKMTLEDPTQEYVRMGAVAYDSYNYYYNVKMNWNPQTVNAYTQSLWANGGTNSSGAMKTAYNALKNKKEENKHAKKNSGKPKKYILFLTDGVNNYSSYDTQTLKHCNNAKTKENVEIFSVAFQAPISAQNMLKQCASSEGHYFKADNAADLIASFNTIGDAATKALAFSE